MRALTNVLLASGSLLGLAGCLPDFSPDPLKSDAEKAADGGLITDASMTGDGGRDGGSNGGGGGDSGGVEPDRDSGGPIETPDTGTGPGPDIGAPEGCDLRGKWFLNEHLLTNVLSALQVAHNWYYWELDQQGSDLTVKVSTSCGGDVKEAAGQILMANADDSAAWPAYAMQKSYAGRKGTVTATADGCMVEFAEDVIVRGATVDHYKDVGNALPTVEQKAVPGGAAGWEDWDNDTKPGVTLKISGLATGDLYAVTRLVTSYKGPASKNPQLMTLNFQWDQTRSNLGSSQGNSGVLGLDASRDPNEAQQLVELARLTDDQAAGDAPALCERLRGLAPTLTPNASKY